MPPATSNHAFTLRAIYPPTKINPTAATVIKATVVMPGKKFNAVSAALEEYKDVRSGSVPTQRSKARRKRYRYANVSLLGTPRWFAPTGTEVWTEKNL